MVGNRVRQRRAVLVVDEIEDPLVEVTVDEARTAQRLATAGVALIEGVLALNDHDPDTATARFMAAWERDPDDLYGDDVVAEIVISVRRNGAMSVAGAINDEYYAIAMCDNAKDAIKSHHVRTKLNANSPVIIPPSYTGLAS